MTNTAAVLSLLLLCAIPVQLPAMERETMATIRTGDMGHSIGPKLAEKGCRRVVAQAQIEGEPPGADH